MEEQKQKNYITDAAAVAEISKTREDLTPQNREVKVTHPQHPRPAADSLHCPYCESAKFTRRGFRQKKHERVQLYLCSACQRTFTARLTKGKRYPLAAILDGISIYNLGYSLVQSCRALKERFALDIGPSSLSNWVEQFSDLCRFCRYREFAVKMYRPQDMIEQATLAHQQLYRYRYHRAKIDLIIKEDIRHRRFHPLKEFLELVGSECPHQYFQEGLRASESPLAFSKKEMIVRGKENYATRLAAFVLQAVVERKQRHEALQKFMIANDSVTVAAEVPVYLRQEDLEHLRTQLGFELYNKSPSGELEPLPPAAAPRLITGHIDLLQIRNGQIHILDYKPQAAKARPIEQLTIYALALSRLTGLRLFEFKCAWFDEKDYFEFFPLHVLYKTKKSKRRRHVRTIEGVYDINLDPNRITSLRPVAI